jgi:opacity protein-like surface antigen
MIKALASTKIATIAAGILAFSAPAHSADIFDKRHDEAYGSAPQGTAVNWTGFYLGGAIGYGNANHDLSVRDYFKGYCSDNTSSIDFDPFSDPDREKTLENRIEAADPNPVWASCEDVDTKAEPDESFSTISGDSREIASLDGLNSTGLVGDIRVGYDQQLSNRLLAGVFGTYGFSSMDADGTNVLFGDSFKLERGDDWSVGARAGVLVNNSTLLYALAAYTQTEYDLSVTSNAATLSKTTTFDGITVGGGIEFAAANNIFLGIEGTHTFYNKETIFDVYDADSNVGTSVDDDLGETKILGTLKIKLNSF